jgi:hypothetical protein
VTGGNYTLPGGSNPYPGMFFAKYVNGGQTELPNPSGPIANFVCQSAKLRIIVKGTNYKVYVNGGATPVMTLKDSSSASGSVALYDNSPQTFSGVGPASPRGETFSKFSLAVP